LKKVDIIIAPTHRFQIGTYIIHIACIILLGDTLAQKVQTKPGGP
jgi:hypothetical protein